MKASTLPPTIAFAGLGIACGSWCALVVRYITGTGVLRAGSATLDFLNRDVERQRALAKEALDEAKRIQKILDDNPDTPHKEELERTKRAFLNLAEQLAKNATETSNNAITAITSAASGTSSG